MAKNKPKLNDLPTGIILPRRIVMVLVGVLGVGTVFYHNVENLSWLDSIYFCVVTLTTVGYGDITPQTAAGKIFTIFYILIGVGIIASSLSYLLKTSIAKRVAGRLHGVDDDIQD
jgi:voltage-gated potassium channel Kch